MALSTSKPTQRAGSFLSFDSSPARRPNGDRSVILKTGFQSLFHAQAVSLPGPPEPVPARAVRFTLTVTTPVVAALVFGIKSGLVYALVSAIVGFAADTGGRPASRLASMAIGAAALALGAFGGTLAAGHHGAIVALFAAAGAFYALTESLDALALTASRFVCFGIAVGALYLPLTNTGAFALVASCLGAWAISCLWDSARGQWRSDHAPNWRALWRSFHERRSTHWPFALAVALAIPLAYLSSVAVGIVRPYWAMLTLVLVLRLDFLSSRQLMLERLAGTLVGVVLAGAYTAAFPTHEMLMIGIVVAALARWPAEQRHGALGVAALTTFVMLVLALASTEPGEVSAFLKARVIDTIVGCLFAVVALYLNSGFCWIKRRWDTRRMQHNTAP